MFFHTPRSKRPTNFIWMSSSPHTVPCLTPTPPYCNLRCLLKTLEIGCQNHSNFLLCAAHSQPCLLRSFQQQTEWRTTEDRSPGLLPPGNHSCINFPSRIQGKIKGKPSPSLLQPYLNKNIKFSTLPSLILRMTAVESLLFKQSSFRAPYIEDKTGFIFSPHCHHCLVSNFRVFFIFKWSNLWHLQRKSECSNLVFSNTLTASTFNFRNWPSAVQVVQESLG